jgi:hypothetical protein
MTLAQATRASVSAEVPPGIRAPADLALPALAESGEVHEP